MSEVHLLNFGNHIPAAMRSDGQDGGLTTHGENIPAAAMVEIMALRRELLAVLIDKPMPLRIAPARGQTIDEMRDNLYHSDLYRSGDSGLFWVNEGDLGLLTLYGNTVYCEYHFNPK